MEQTSRAVDGTVDALVEAVDDVPALLLHDIANVANNSQAVLASFPLIVLKFRLACVIYVPQNSSRSGDDLLKLPQKRSTCPQHRR